MTTRALGWKKQAEDERDHDALKVMLRAVPDVPASANNGDLVKIVNQGQLGSCTANGSGQAVRAAQILEIVEKKLAAWIAAGNAATLFDATVATAEANATLEFWSRLFAYYLARSFEGSVKDDAGASIRDIFRGINKFGFCAESAWPYNDNSDPAQGPTPFNHMPSAEAFREAYDQRASAANVNAKVIDYALIKETGDTRVAAIKLAVAQRHLVVFGTLVTERFCSDMSANNYEPIAPPTDEQNIAGGHCMAVGGYDENGPDIINSWDKDFGRLGWCKFSWDYMKWDQTNDLWIVRRAPLLVAA